MRLSWPLGTSNPHHQLASLRTEGRIRWFHRMSSSEFAAGSKSPSAEVDVVDVRGELETNYSGGVVTETKQNKIRDVFRFFFLSNFLEIDCFFVFFFGLLGRSCGDFWGDCFLFPHNLGPPLSDFFVIATLSTTLDTTWLIYCDFVCNLSVPKRPKLRFMFCCWHNNRLAVLNWFQVMVTWFNASWYQSQRCGLLSMVWILTCSWWISLLTSDHTKLNQRWPQISIAIHYKP